MAGHQEGSLGIIVVAKCCPRACARAHTHHLFTKPRGTLFLHRDKQWMTPKKPRCCLRLFLFVQRYNICTLIHDEVLIPPLLQIRMSGSLPFFSSNRILTCWNPHLFEHAHVKWTCSQVPSQGYCSSGVRLGRWTQTVGKVWKVFTWQRVRHWYKYCFSKTWSSSDYRKSQSTCFWQHSWFVPESSKLDSAHLLYLQGFVVQFRRNTRSSEVVGYLNVICPLKSQVSAPSSPSKLENCVQPPKIGLNLGLSLFSQRF